MTDINSFLKSKIKSILETEDRNVYNIKCLNPTDQKQIKMLAQAISFDYPKKSWKNVVQVKCIEINGALYVQLELNPKFYLSHGRYCENKVGDVAYIRNNEGKLVPMEGGDLND